MSCEPTYTVHGVTLARMLGLSLLLHLALLAAWPRPAAVPVAAAIAPDLAVSLQWPAPAMPAPPTPVRHRTGGNESLQRPAPAAVQPGAAAHPPLPRIAAQAPAPLPRPSRHTAPQNRAADAGPAPGHSPVLKAIVASLAAPPAAAAPARATAPPRDARAAQHPTPPVALAAAPAPSPAARHAAQASPRPTAAVQRILQRRLQARFEYPLIARAHGWEGRVELGLRVEADGTLSHLRVIRTSGYSILDQASLQALSDIARVPGAAGWLNGRPVDMTLPVEYRLTGG